MHYSRLVNTLSAALLIGLATAQGCLRKPPPPDPESTEVAPLASASAAATATMQKTKIPVVTTATTASSHAASATRESAPISVSPAIVSPTPVPFQGGATTGTPSTGDPLQGKFTLEDAVKGLPKAGKLIADLATDAGTLKCELYEDKAPNTVANFVGLARGLRPFKDPKTGVWGKRPGYDNGVFHRVIKGFMIQGGDPTGTGGGEAGYVIPDEVWPGAAHDRRGLICMANRGKNTNSMQFFIMDGAARHLDGGYTIFGTCGPDSVIEKLAATEVRGDRALNPPKIEKVTIRRGK